MHSIFEIDEKYRSLLGQAEAEVLMPLMQPCAFDKNAALIPAGQRVKDVFYIRKGIVRLFMPDERGKEVNTHIAWDGMFITSLFSFLNDKISDECVVTVTPCELLRINFDKLLLLYDQYPKIERLARYLVEEAFCCLACRGRMLQTMTARERYQHFMDTTPKEVFFNIPLQEIASFLGIAPGSLSRIRNGFLHTC